MNDSAHRFKQKAQGFIEGISTMSAQARSKQPTGEFGNDYNGMKTSIIQLLPDLLKYMPPDVEIIDSDYFGKTCRQSFDEILVYCQQIVNMLP
jgi:hypothetical protein